MSSWLNWKRNSKGEKQETPAPLIHEAVRKCRAGLLPVRVRAQEGSSGFFFVPEIQRPDFALYLLTSRTFSSILSLPLGYFIRRICERRGDVRAYTAVIEKCPDTGIFVGYIPGLRGAHSQGETLDELNNNLKEVVELLLEDGEPELETEFIGTQSVVVA